MLSINSLPKDKILDWSKFKAFAHDKINVTENLKNVLGRVENIAGKGETTGFQQMFSIRKSINLQNIKFLAPLAKGH